jgi:hypothetical protein
MRFTISTPDVRRTLALLAFGIGAVGLARPAAAQYAGALVTYGNHCVLPYEGLAPQKVAVRVNLCSQQGARYSIANGVVRTTDGLCMDHEVTSSMTPTDLNAGVILVKCTGVPSQTWYFMKNGLAQNAANPKVCLDIQGGKDVVATRLLVWPCDFKSDYQNSECAKGNMAGNCPKSNQRFFVGNGGISTVSLASAGLPASAQTTLNNGGSLTFNDGMRIVAAGGGNIVAAGGGNIVAGGGGNIVAAGGGNIRNAIGTTLIGPDFASLRNALLLGGGFQNITP